MITTVLLDDDKLGLSIKDKLNNLRQIEGIDYIPFSLGKLDPPSSNGLNFIFLNKQNDLEQVIGILKPKNVTWASSKKMSDFTSDLAITAIGLQRHLNTTDNAANLQTLFLSDILGNIKISEPSIRDSDLFLFDMNVLRGSEINHAEFSNPSGIFTEEATQMFRYAGMSESNKSVIIMNAHESHIDLLTQFVWYYSEAASNRFPDHPYFKETVHQYVVNMPSIDGSISFFKSKASGRWWVKKPGTEENKWKACNYEDYADACNDEISPLILGMLASAE